MAGGRDDLKDPVAGLDARRRQLLEALLKEQAAAPREAPREKPIPRLPRDRQGYPLSFAQERLWVIDQIEPGNVTYNNPYPLRLTGRLRRAVLAASLTELVRRHEVLRTRFASAAEGPLQVVMPPRPVALPEVDLTALGAARREKELVRLATADSLRPFDLARGPVMRALLVDLSPAGAEREEHALLFTLHHIASDGWSLAVLVRELVALYQSFAAGLPSPLPPLPIQYVDYAAWQRQTIGGEGFARSLAYWRRQLAGVPILALPSDRPRPPVQGVAGGSVPFEERPQLAEDLKAVGRAHRATLFMVVTAAFQALLARETGQLDIAVGTPVANRHRTETEGLIGFFVNTLVLRTDLSGDPTFAALLERVREVAFRAFEHGQVPFSRLVEELRPERNLSHTPLFQAMCALGNTPSAHPESRGLAFESIEPDVITAMFDLNLTVLDRSEGLYAGLEYRAELFDRTTVQRLLGHFGSLLRAAAARPDLRLSELPLLSAAERQALAVEWNDTAAPAGESLERRLASRVERTPDAAALTWERGGEPAALTFRAAAARAGRLARQLRARGVGPGDLVAIAAERSPEAVLGVLAALMSGAAYLPLDPAYPSERLAWMLADSGAAALLAGGPGAAIPAFDGPLLPLAAIAEEGAGEGADVEGVPEWVEAPPESLAYVIYTSGSTGRPKGVAMVRSALANLLAWQERALPGAAATLQFASLSFDVSFQEIASTWGAGGALALVSEELRRDPRALLARLASAGVERLFLPFVALRQLAEEAEETGSAAPREVVTAGEALQVTPSLARWLAGSGARLDNQYGPTETHVVTAWTLAGDPCGWRPLPPIGRPIANVAVHLLDADLVPVPIGVAGELCAGGAALARGYLGRPRLTAERFVPDPFAGPCGAPGARLYRTGDLARWRADGTLEFLGRRDTQVKIRGVRVEPAEVEAALLRHPAVAQAVVVARPEPDGSALRLVAYHVPRDGAAASAAELRDLLVASLPGAFVPAVFMAVAELPLTPSGKVDRAALARSGPLPEDGGAAEHVAPRGAVEETLAEIWASLLGLARVGARDNFFALGGHSLLATRLVSRVRRTFAVELPQRALFEAPVLADLAARIAALAGGSAAAAPIPRYADDGPAPLSFAQERLWLIDRIEPGTPVYNLPSALRLAGEVAPALLAATLGEVVRRHGTLRTRFAAGAGQPVQIVEPPGPFALPLADLSGLAAERREAETRRLAAEEARRSFDLLRGPVLRALLVRLGAADHALLLTMHHIASDGWSSGILVYEVSQIYPALAAGRRPELPDLPVRYTDYARWQRETLQGEALERLVGYWREKLGGEPQPLALPTDRPRPPVQSPDGATEPFALADPLSAALRALAQREGATLFMLVVAALQSLLARIAHQSDVAVGSPVAGRGRAELEGLIGFFVNTLVLRTDLSGDPPFRAVLARVRQTALEAYAHQDLPFEKLIGELNPERSLSHTPLFQVMCVMQNAPTHALDLAGLSFAPLDLPSTTAKFDWTLSAVDTPEGIGGSLEYRTELFDRATAERTLAHLATLLAGAAAAPETPLSRLPLLPAAERTQLLHEWSGEAVEDAEPPALLHELFEAWARRAPEAPAVLADGETLSYGELDRRAARLAARLQAAGVGPESRVGICLTRSAALPVAALGVLKAGAAYVPLDPDYPAERLDFMAEDAGLAALLAGEGGGWLPRGRSLPVLRLAADGSPLDAAPPSPATVAAKAAHADPRSLAYAIYTSGSTGRPKGVDVPHAAVVQTIRAALPLYDLAPGDRVLPVTSPSFDVSVLEIFVSLAAGACLCLSRGGPLSGPELAAELRERRISAVFLTPSVLATLGEADLPDLRTLVVGAEICPAELARRWSAGRRLVNIYGPTEAAIFATAWLSGPFRQSVPIGRPVAGARIYVLDGWELSPVGVPGEIHIGGGGVARGYLGRPERTAESFVPDPFGGVLGGELGARSRLGGELGARLYRTGDLGRWLAGGELEILGRADSQVKVRGFRIEPGEIESALTAHPSVDRAAVVLWGKDRLVAYVVPPPGSPRERPADLAAALRAHLRGRLPEFMLPSAFVAIDALPVTASGKLDRKALPSPESAREPAREPARDPVRRAAGAPAAPRSEIERKVAAIWQEVLGLPEVGTGDSFFDLGGHSLLLVDVQAKLAEQLGEEVSLLELFKYPTVAALAGYLRERSGAHDVEAPLAAGAERATRGGAAPVGSRDVAVVGMACRFPGAPDLEALWRNLRDGVESISFFSRDELAAGGIDPAVLDDPLYVPASGVLDGAELFDAAFFDVSPREARRIDPQQRVFLEVAAEALERAGYAAGVSAGISADGARRLRVGVYAGAGINSYAFRAVADGESGMDLVVANDKDFLATRVSYKLNLRGPAVAVQTACSTSLVAIHLAAQSLLAGECDLALAGGVTIQFPQRTGYVYQEGGTSSPDGHNRAFDARAGGTVASEGAGVVVLKPLAAALADGDTVHAVLKATAINNDGSSKIGFLAPSEEGQAEVIAAAQSLAGVAPETVGYVETHGSATPIGDPIEVAALIDAFRAGGATGTGFCALGSIKSNLGHTGAAAGVAGFIKAVLAVERGEIPPSLHYETPNPAIPFAGSPFRVASSLAPWPEPVDAQLRRAGVSSFGLGGTNAHAVLEEAPAREPASPSRPWQLLSLSARSAPALEAATDRLASHLASEVDEELADVAFTLHVGRRGYEHRRIVVAESREDASSALGGRDPRRVLTSALPRGAGERPVAFLFSGLGEQYPGFASGLYRDEPAFRATFDRCAEALRPELGLDLRELLFPAEQGPEVGGGVGGLDLRRLVGRGGAEPAPGPLDRTAVLQPALFAVEASLASVWREWGLTPRAMLGYSLGEYVAAWVAGVMSLPDALRLVAARARLIDALPEGAMLAVPLPEEEALRRIAPSGELSLSAVNGPSLSVVAGPVDAVAALEAQLGSEGMAVRRLRTTHAFHSRMMLPAVEALTELARGIELRAPRIPYLSNVTGTWITGEQATDPGYWSEHMCRPVRFGAALAELWREPEQVLLEIGPGQSLATLALQHPGASSSSDPVAVGSLRSAYERRPDRVVLLESLGKLWLAGVRVDWPGVYGRERRRRLPLPTYAWEHQRYTLEGEPRSSMPHSAPEAAGAEAPAASTSLYVASWRRSPAPAPPPPGELAGGGRWLVFAEGAPGDGQGGLGEALAARLRAGGLAVVVVRAGERFAAVEDGQGEAGPEYAIDPTRPEDYAALLAALTAGGGALPERVVHLWSLAPPATAEPDLDAGFHSLLLLARALGEALAARSAAGLPVPGGMEAAIVASGLEQVSAADLVDPARAPLAALRDVLPQEVPGLVCRTIDLAGMAGPAGHQATRQAALLAAELAAAGRGRREESAVAYRGRERWVRSFEPVPAGRGGEVALAAGSAVVAMGAFDGPLRKAALHLARTAGARVASIGPGISSEASADAGIPAYAADLGDGVRLAEILADVEARLGPVGAVLLGDLDGADPVPRAPIAALGAGECGRRLAAVRRREAALRAALGDRELDLCLRLLPREPLAAGPGDALAAALDLAAEALAGEGERAGGPPRASLGWIPPTPLAEGSAGAAPGPALDLLRACGPARFVASPAEPWAALARLAAPASVGEEPAVGERTGGMHARPKLRNPYVAPSSDLERQVTEIWRDLLGISPVGLHDSFFDLGGDSLLGAQVITRVRERFGADVPLADLFELPTPAGLAARIEAAQAAGEESEAARLDRMLARLDDLSPEEVERMLAERGAS